MRRTENHAQYCLISVINPITEKLMRRAKKSSSLSRNLCNEPYNRKMNEKDRKSCSVSRNLYNEPITEMFLRRTENHAQ